MCNVMEFPETVEEFMDEYKMVDTEQVYSNGTEYVPIYRMKQWFQAHEAIPIEWLKKHSWYGVIEYWEKDQKRNNSKEVLYSLLEDHGFNSYEEYINWATDILAIPRDDRVRFLEEERENGSNP